MSEKMTEKEMINYIDTLEEQNGRVIKDKEELIKQLKAKTLSQETIEVVEKMFKAFNFSETAIKAQQEFNAVYGGSK